MYVYNIYKAVLIITFSYVMFLKISGWRVGFFRKVTIGILYVFVLSILIWLLSACTSEPYKSILVVLFSWVFLKTAAKELQENIVVSITISYVASQILYLLATVTAAIITIAYYWIRNSNVVKEVLMDTAWEVFWGTALLGLVVEIIFFIVFMKNKPCTFIPQKILGSIGISITGIAAILYSLSRSETFSNEGWTLFILGIGICAAGLGDCLKKERIIAYNDRLNCLSEEKIRNELKETQEDIDRLEHMAHLNAKRLPAYRKAVEELVNSAPDGGWKERAVEILNGLREAEEEQSSELIKMLQAGKVLPSCGMVLLDAVFVHMQDRAAREGIDFDLIIHGDLSGITGIIKQLELEVLAADLIENAMIAVRNGGRGHKGILVFLRVSGGIHELKVEDNGMPFEASTLACLGEHRITTNADAGGSGIGYMKIFEIIRQYNASLIITEKPPISTRHSKTVAVRFDGENRRMIRSYRSDAIKKGCSDGKWVISDYAE